MWQRILKVARHIKGSVSLSACTAAARATGEGAGADAASTASSLDEHEAGPPQMLTDLRIMIDKDLVADIPVVDWDTSGWRRPSPWIKSDGSPKEPEHVFREPAPMNQLPAELLPHFRKVIRYV
jgi:hypothetical protein